jgi:hypothetical protein
MPDQKSIFDDMDAVRRDAAQLKPPSSPKHKKRQRSSELFARIPYDRAFRLHKRISAAAWIVLIELDRLMLTSAKGRNPFEFNPDHLLTNLRIGRATVYRCLHQLEKAKVIKVDWQRGKEAAVTHLWYPTSS